jgi:hypothetical protein
MEKTSILININNFTKKQNLKFNSFFYIKKVKERTYICTYTYFKSQISWLVLLFSIFVLTPFLLFFQYHKMLEKNKKWNYTVFLILSNFHFNYFGIKLLGEPIIETLYFYM